MNPHASAANSDVRSESVSSNVVVTWFSGYVTSELAENRLPEFRELILRCTSPTWIMELSGMSGFDPRAVAAGAKWWRLFKEREGQEILFISAQTAARMAGASLAFSTRVQVRTFDSLEDCFKTLGIILPVRRSIPPLG